MVSRELVIAFGTLSIPVLGFLINQREDIVPIYRHSISSLFYVGATAIMLFLSVMLAAFVAGGEVRPSVPVFIVQCLSVTWGVALLLTPLAFDLASALRDSMDPRVYEWLGPVIILVPVFAAVILAAQFLPWWLTLASLASSALALKLRVQYGSPVERLLGRSRDEA